jgi:Adenylate and Guanylate cyclase catalytic domain
VNTASRIESSGIRDKIQVSQATADHLIAAGKRSWLKKRDDLIEAKGKGTWFPS